MNKRQVPRLRHIPQRTCIACGEKREKKELVRIVRTASGVAEVDPTGKKSGRGAYLCKAQACWESGLRKDRLEHVLRTKISPENRQQLLEYGGGFTDVKGAGV
jgi:hypothetical protein